jgi:hypothetical protein
MSYLMEYILDEIKQFDLIQIDITKNSTLSPGKYIKYSNNYFESNITFFIVDVTNYNILKLNQIIYKINSNFDYLNMLEIYYNFCLIQSLNTMKFYNKRICLKKNYIGLKNSACSIYIIKIKFDNIHLTGNKFCLNDNFDKFNYIAKYFDNRINNLITIYYNLM